MRVALYARFSSDLQSARSVDDQIRLCQERVAKETWRVVDIYSDFAISGSTARRPGYQQMLEDATHGRFDIVMAEALDRLSRDQEETARLFKLLTFHGVRIATLLEGEVSELHVGLSSTINAVFLKSLAEKTRRGQRGRVQEGKIAGGLCFGYRPDYAHNAHGEPTRGDREIVEAEAAIVRRIFSEYVCGKSPRSIARDLNIEGASGPRGGKWSASTLLGNPDRGTGVLRNELYAGRVVWNRQKFIKDPVTGKRQARPNPKSDWVIADVPQLRIVSDDIWTAAQDRLSSHRRQVAPKDSSNRLNPTHRPRYLLSGLLRCGVCGGPLSVAAQGRYGCANHRERGICDNRRTVARDDLERRVLSGLKERLLAPELVQQFIAEYIASANERRRAASSERQSRQQELQSTTHRIQQIVRAIEDGTYSSALKTRLEELEHRREMLQADLNAADEPLPALHPNAADLYRRRVAELESALADPETMGAAREALRELIEAIIVHPGEKRGEVRIELFGELGAILRLGEARKAKDRSSGETAVSLVAGAGFEPAAFRL
ncbi:MAG: recombinase family protein [Magnetospirillum sp. WYHS-4]